MNYLKKLMVFLFLSCFVSPVFTQFGGGIDSENSLDDVVAHARRMLTYSSKKEVAEWVTKTVDDRLDNSNSEELFPSLPEMLFEGVTAGKLLSNYVSRSSNIRAMRNHKDYDEYDGMAKLAWQNELGNCGENSYVTYYILKKAGAKGHIRILEAGKKKDDGTVDGAHSFTVWGMPPDAMINDPATWGDGLVVDPWLGKVLNAKEAMENKWIKNTDPNVLVRDATNDHDTEAEIWNAIWREEMKRIGKEIPKNSTSDEELEDCFIATAVYGTPTNDKIEILRTFRDQKLRKTFVGRKFIVLYETFGPLAAHYIRGNEKRKLWARKNIVEPALAIAEKNKN